MRDKIHMCTDTVFPLTSVALMDQLGFHPCPPYRMDATVLWQWEQSWLLVESVCAYSVAGLTVFSLLFSPKSEICFLSTMTLIPPLTITKTV